MKDTILSLEHAAMERWRSGDPWGFVELSAPEINYVDVGLTKPIVGLEAYSAYMKQFERQVCYQRSEFIDPRAVVVGDAAVLSYNYRSSTIAEDGTITGQTPWNTTEVYVRRDGGWKIAHTHWSFTHQRLPETLEIPVPMQLSAKPHEGVLGEVMALESAAMERWRKGDPWGFTDICDPDVSYFDTETPRRVNGLEAMKALYAPCEGKIFFDVMDFVDPWVQVYGDLVVLGYRFLSTRLNGDGSVACRTPWNCTEVFKRTESGWRIIHTHWSFIKGERA